MSIDIINPKVDMRLAYLYLMKDLGFQWHSIRYIGKRIHNEGVSFITRVLPRLSKHILRCIERKEWCAFGFEGGSPLKTKHDPKTGNRYTYFIYDELYCLFSEIESPDFAYNLWRIRQLCEYSYKLCLPADSKALEEAEEEFEDTDANLSFDRDFADNMRKEAEYSFKSTFNLTNRDVVPHVRFGPGTYSGYRDYEGDRLQHKKDLLDGTYPERYEPVKGAFRSRKTSIMTGQRKSLKTRDAGPTYSTVMFVPKNSDAHRTIVCEPADHIQWQMGVHEVLRTSLQTDTRGRIQFDSQSKFRDLARSSSLDRQFATLDLSKASDSVHHRIAAVVFRNCSALANAINYCRTQHALLPSGRLIRLNKLAGMGSGLTFPCMAACIFCAIVANVPRSLRPFARKNVYVYGDDIVVHISLLRYAEDGLAKAGFSINESKSYSKSYFRESCGGDYYMGQDVAPVRLKQLFVANSTRGTQVFPVRPQEYDAFILKLERHCRELVKNGLLKLADFYYRVIEDALTKALPEGSGVTNALVRYRLTKPFCEDGTTKVFIPKPIVYETINEGLDRSFRNKLLSYTEDSLGVLNDAVFGVESERYKVRLSEVDMENLLLDGSIQDTVEEKYKFSPRRLLQI